MEDAKKKLEKAQQEDAAKDQEEAIKELEQAKAELEQILRQLREEEIERVLAMLEARFRKMLEMQREVYDATVSLDKTPTAERTHNHEIESSRLGGKEMQIVVEVDKALLMLREDGTTVAFAEAADQMRTDMQQVVDRLSQAKVGQVTQGIEMDIIATLEEMIESLKKARKDMDKNRQKPNMQSGARTRFALVDKLAELKDDSRPQMRINTRTQRYSKMIEGEQAENAELVVRPELLRTQQRVYRVTHDLSSGKTEKGNILIVAFRSAKVALLSRSERRQTANKHRYSISVYEQLHNMKINSIFFYSHCILLPLNCQRFEHVGVPIDVIAK